MYYRGAAAAIVVYDVTHPASFERAKKCVRAWVAGCVGGWGLGRWVAPGEQRVAGCGLQTAGSRQRTQQALPAVSGGWRAPGGVVLPPFCFRPPTKLAHHPPPACRWVWELRQNVQNAALIIALVGNKVDLAEEGRQVAEADARTYAGERQLRPCDTWCTRQPPA